MTVLETDRLVLRHLAAADAEFILRLLNEPSFHRYIGDRGVRTLDDARAYVANGPAASYERHGFGLYLTALKEEGTPIGICGLVKRDTLEHADLGFAFLPEHWKQGYALESATAMLAHARRDHGLDHLLAITSLDNESSIRLLEKIGFRCEGNVKLSPDGETIKRFSRDLQG